MFPLNQLECSKQVVLAQLCSERCDDATVPQFEHGPGLRGDGGRGLQRRPGGGVLPREGWNPTIAVGRTRAKAPAKSAFVDHERKSEERTRSGTAVVPTVNHADRLRGDVPSGEASRGPGEIRVPGLRGEYGRKAET